MKSITVKYKGEEIQVREITLEELRDALSGGPMTILEQVFDGEMINQKMLEVATGLSEKDLYGYPSEIRPLVEACKEVNPDFLSGMASIMARKKE